MLFYDCPSGGGQLAFGVWGVLRIVLRELDVDCNSARIMKRAISEAPY
jgi:hypothetical protein